MGVESRPELPAHPGLARVEIGSFPPLLSLQLPGRWPDGYHTLDRGPGGLLLPVCLSTAIPDVCGAGQAVHCGYVEKVRCKSVALRRQFLLSTNHLTLFFFFNFLNIHSCIQGWTWVCHRAHVREKLVKVGFFLQPCGSWDQTKEVRLVSNYLYQLSHIDGP